MTISSVSSTDSLLKRLETNGLSADKAKLVDTDLAAAEKSVSASLGTTSTPVSAAAVRAALDSRIDADVSSGKLSASDAATVRKTLDDVDKQADGATVGAASTPATASTATGAAAGAGGASGGGGGGGGSASKTELSETVTITGSTKTTVITYTDNSTATTTTTASDVDKMRYGKPTSAGTTADTAQSYLATIEPGSLVDQTA